MKHQIALFAVTVCSAAVAAEPKVDLWSYVSDNADAVLYVNTLQAEKAVDGKLYGEITKEKHKAIDEADEDDKSLFADKNRDLEGIANVFLVGEGGSTGLRIEGVARAHGGKKSVKDDLKKLTADAKENGLHVITEKAGKLDVTRFRLAKSDEAPQMDACVTPLDNELFHFRFFLDSPVSSGYLCSKGGGVSNPSVLRLAESDASLALLCDARKIAGYISSTNGNAAILKNVLSQAKTATLICRARAKSFMIAVTLDFLAAETATAYSQMMSPMLTALNGGMSGRGKLFSDFSVRTVQNRLTLSFDIGIEEAWKHVMEISDRKRISSGKKILKK